MRYLLDTCALLCKEYIQPRRLRTSLILLRSDAMPIASTAVVSDPGIKARTGENSWSGRGALLRQWESLYYKTFAKDQRQGFQIVPGVTPAEVFAE